MTSLTGKSIVITGAGRGLGAEYARQAAQAGAQVVVNDIDGDEAQSVARSIEQAGGRALASHHDIVDPQQAAELIASCVGEFGRLDGLVNNAGLFHVVAPWDQDLEAARRLVEVNVLGTINCGVHAMRTMRDQRGGVILNVTSGSSLGIPGMGAYGASKGAVLSLTQSWSLDTEGTGIRVNAVSPIAATRMMVSGGHSLDRGPRPETIAPVVVFLLSDAAATIRGQVVRLDGQRLSLMVPAHYSEQGWEQGTWDSETIARLFAEGRLGPLQPVGLARRSPTPE